MGPYRQFLSHCRVRMVNTVMPAKETQERIREALEVKQK